MGADSMQSMGWIEIVVFGVIALGFGFWQLYSINKEMAQDKQKADKAKAERTKTDGDA